MCSFNYLFCKFTQWFLVFLNEIFQMRENYIALDRDGYPKFKIQLNPVRFSYLFYSIQSTNMWRLSSRTMYHGFHYLWVKIISSRAEHTILCRWGNYRKVLTKIDRLRLGVSLWLWSIVLEQLLKKQSFINKLSGIRSDDRFDRESWHRGAILWLYFIWHNHRRVVCVWLISELYYYNKDCIGYI